MDGSEDRQVFGQHLGFVGRIAVPSPVVADSIAIRRISWRRPRAFDFRAVQGAVAADGLGNLLSGLTCTVPNTTDAKSVSLTELIGVAARSVGLCVGVVFVVLAQSVASLRMMLRSLSTRASWCSTAASCLIAHTLTPLLDTSSAKASLEKS